MEKRPQTLWPFSKTVDAVQKTIELFNLKGLKQKDNSSLLPSFIPLKQLPLLLRKDQTMACEVAGWYEKIPGFLFKWIRVHSWSKFLVFDNISS